MIINGIEVPETPDVESFSVRVIEGGVAARVRVRFRDGRRPTGEFVGEGETICDAIALGVNAIVAYAEEHNRLEGEDGNGNDE